MADILGLRGTGDFASDERTYDWREMILLLFPNGSAPITALTSRIGSEGLIDPQFHWWEKAAYFPRFEVGPLGGAGDEADVDIEFREVGAGARAEGQLRKGDMLLDETTGERMRVTIDGVDGTPLVVIRDWATDGTYTTADGNPILKIGTAYEEGAAAGSGLAYFPTKMTNYSEIFRNSLEFTRTARLSHLRTGDKIKEAKREALEMHSVDMELAFIYGKAVESTGSGGKPVRTTDGVRTLVIEGTNYWANADGNVTDEEFDANMRDLFKFGSTEKLCLCGNHALMVLNQMARAGTAFQAEPGTEIVYGMRLKRIVTAFGDLLVRSHPLFTQHPVYTKEALFVDMPFIKYRALTDTKFIKNRANNDVDASKDEFLTECGLELQHESVHGLYQNMDQYVP